MEVGEILKSIRNDKKLTQTEVCKKVKITQTFLSQVEAGKKAASPEMFKRLCKFYGIPHQVVIWKSLSEKDVPKEKRGLFKQLSPAIDSLINEFFVIK